MFNKNKAERDMLYAEVSRLKKLNKKLEDENRRLREGLEDIERYREKYKELTESIGDMQKRYADKLRAFDELGVVYGKELEKMGK